jgi:leader peptidase (prepilin peptidase) / N-methyltransferase
VQPIGIFYPLIEIGAVAVALWSVTAFSDWLVSMSCVLGWTLLVLAVSDYRYFVLPDLLTLPLMLFGVIGIGVNDSLALLDSLIGVIAGFGFIIGVRESYRRFRGGEGIGVGDAKLLAASGAFVSWHGLPAVVLIASLAALGFVLLQSLRGVTITFADRIPFGTFLCGATWITWPYGPSFL